MCSITVQGNKDDILLSGLSIDICTQVFAHDAFSSSFSVLVLLLFLFFSFCFRVEQHKPLEPMFPLFSHFNLERRGVRC